MITNNFCYSCHDRLALTQFTLLLLFLLCFCLNGITSHFFFFFCCRKQIREESLTAMSKHHDILLLLQVETFASLTYIFTDMLADFIWHWNIMSMDLYYKSLLRTSMTLNLISVKNWWHIAKPCENEWDGSLLGVLLY